MKILCTIFELIDFVTISLINSIFLNHEKNI